MVVDETVKSGQQSNDHPNGAEVAGIVWRLRCEGIAKKLQNDTRHPMESALRTLRVHAVLEATRGVLPWFSPAHERVKVRAVATNTSAKESHTGSHRILG